METITFYSYKGGVGRTLMVANVARYLTRFGLNVFLIDFDLEAPGLHYKLLAEYERDKIKCGLVDYIYSFRPGLEPSIELTDCVFEIEFDPLSDDPEGWAKLMPAGNVPTREYWRRLARINWHDLFYGEDAQGIPFFLELQARIAEEYKPDFLLIDSRTGITEIGGVTTTVLADKVICLLLHNPENLEGAREVLRSIKAEPRIEGQLPVEIIPVITRLPEGLEQDKEEKILKEVKDYLNALPQNLSDTLDLAEVFVVHSEPDLQVEEELRVGGDKQFDESPLLRDYLRIFDKFVKKEVLEKKLPIIVELLKKSFLDHPYKNQKILEELALSYPKHEVVEELYRIYEITKAPWDYILERAYEWQQRGLSEDDPILLRLQKEYLQPLLNQQEMSKYHLNSLEKIYRAAGKSDVKYLGIFVSILKDHGQKDKAEALSKELKAHERKKAARAKNKQ